MSVPTPRQSCKLTSLSYLYVHTDSPDNTFISPPRLHTDGPEHVESRVCGAGDDARHLWVPVQLLEVGLTLVDEEQLWRHIRLLRLVRRALPDTLLLVPLHSQVPHGQLVIRAGRCKHCAVVEIPLY